jgi:hypothetical protein
MPAIVRLALALLATAHVPARVILMVGLVTVVVAPVQVPENPVPKVIVGLAGTVKPAGNTTVTESPAPSAPVELAMKLAVQLAAAPATRDALEKLTPETAVAAAIITLAGLRLAAVSLVVRTLNVVPVYVAAVGFVMPATSKTPLVEDDDRQLRDVGVALMLTVTTEPTAVALETLHPEVKPDDMVTVGDAGTTKFVLKVIVTVSPLPRLD